MHHPQHMLLHVWLAKHVMRSEIENDTRAMVIWDELFRGRFWDTPCAGGIIAKDRQSAEYASYHEQMEGIDWKSKDDELLSAVKGAVANLPPRTTMNNWQNRVGGNDSMIPISLSTL